MRLERERRREFQAVVRLGLRPKNNLNFICLRPMTRDFSRQLRLQYMQR